MLNWCAREGVKSAVFGVDTRKAARLFYGTPTLYKTRFGLWIARQVVVVGFGEDVTFLSAFLLTNTINFASKIVDSLLKLK